MTEKTYPQRTCVGCRQIKAKGRGAYVCPDRNCIEAAFKKGALEKSLRCRIPKEAQDEIIRELTEFENQNT